MFDVLEQPKALESQPKNGVKNRKNLYGSRNFVSTKVHPSRLNGALDHFRMLKAPETGEL